ncbi:MAG TPA: alpha/beta family hydrolase [Acidimicrobiales bacterium]|nr:alpha/beta family hydrolase [Acidimicrobiales bacterium]
MTSKRGLLVAPGAGAGSDQPSLVAIDEALGAAGVAVRRMDFPYRLAGRRAPDRPPVLLAAVRENAAALAAEAGLQPSAIVLGGRSMGGRMCSMAVADGLPAAGLALISYPLHPPGKPEKPRTEHFPSLTVPCLFVSGTRDSFGRPDELEAATAMIPGPVTHVWIDGGDHGLRRRDAVVAEAVRDWVLALRASPRSARPRG